MGLPKISRGNNFAINFLASEIYVFFAVVLYSFEDYMLTYNDKTKK